MNPREASFDDLVARIDDGRPIDWELEARQVSAGDDRDLVHALRTLSEVAAGLRAAAPSRPTAPDGPGTTWCELRVFEIVGRGAFGTVHRAIDPLHRTVALKLLDAGLDTAAMKRRILAEGRLLARVRHQNIAVVHGTGEADGRVGMWMEFIEGVTLAAEVESHGPMSAEEATTIGRKVCAALVAIHGADCVHGDIKAHNVMRERGGRIVLMDFGAAEALAEAGTGRVAGTPLYLSPERLAGASASPAGDIYALGVLLYFLVTRTYPVEGDTREDVERAHVDGRRAQLRDRRSDLPDGFVTAVEGALARDPSARYPTAGAFDAALARVTNTPTTSTAGGDRGASSAAPLPEGARSRTPPWLRGWTLVAVAAALVVASALTIFRVAGRPAERLSLIDPKASAGTKPAAADYLVHAAFFLVGEKGREAKVSGMRIKRGDVLELDLRLSRDATVYVVNEDDEGTASLLFPLAGGNTRNPLRGGQTYTLPGPSGVLPVQWEIDSFGGREHFYIIVSPTVDPTIQAAIDRLTPASDNPSPPMSASAERSGAKFRGAGKLAHVAVASDPANAPWRKLARPLSQQEEGARGLWVRELTLENPRPR